MVCLSVRAVFAGKGSNSYDNRAGGSCLHLEVLRDTTSMRIAIR